MKIIIKILTALRNLLNTLIQKLEKPIVKDKSNPKIGEIWNVKNKPFLIIAKSGNREFTGYMLTGGKHAVTVDVNGINQFMYYNRARIHTYSRFLLVEKLYKITKPERKRVIDIAARYIRAEALPKEEPKPVKQDDDMEEIMFDFEMDMGGTNEIKRVN